MYIYISINVLNIDNSLISKNVKQKIDYNYNK